MKEWFYDTIRNDISLEIRNEILDSKYNILSRTIWAVCILFGCWCTQHEKNKVAVFFDFEYAGKRYAKFIDWTENRL